MEVTEFDAKTVPFGPGFRLAPPTACAIPNESEAKPMSDRTRRQRRAALRVPTALQNAHRDIGRQSTSPSSAHVVQDADQRHTDQGKDEQVASIDGSLCIYDRIRSISSVTCITRRSADGPSCRARRSKWRRAPDQVRKCDFSEMNLGC
jgi:hypothetical protein